MKSGKFMYRETSAISLGSTIGCLPWYAPGTLASTLQKYLEEKPVEYELSEPSHYQYLPKTPGNYRFRKMKITFTHLPRKFFQDVIFPEIKRIGKKYGRTPRLRFPYTYSKKRKKLIVFI